MKTMHFQKNVMFLSIHKNKYIIKSAGQKWNFLVFYCQFDIAKFPLLKKTGLNVLRKYEYLCA